MLSRIIVSFALATTSLAADPWGRDADLCRSCNVAPPPALQSGPLITLSEVLIGFHKTVISPADGPRSHYKPSSSQYTLDAIHLHGFFWGFLLGCDRLMRENNDPWVYRTISAEGGLQTKWDPVKP